MAVKVTKGDKKPVDGEVGVFIPGMKKAVDSSLGMPFSTGPNYTLDVSPTSNAYGQQKPPPGAVSSNALEWEDEFKGAYGLGNALPGSQIIQPPYNLRHLESLVDRNNALGPCIAAMITNIDGTGWTIEPKDKDKPENGKNGEKNKKNKKPIPEKKFDSGFDQPQQTQTSPGTKTGENEEEPVDPKIEALSEFFNEPWPGISFTTMRKTLRRDVKRTGNAYLEILRNVAGEIVFARVVDSKTMRLVSLDAGYYVEKKIMRGGVETSVTVHVRRRRYVQKINTKYIYFKEFGAEKDVNRDLGSWIEPTDTTTPPTQRATEIIHFIDQKDVTTPYGVPQWIAQIPSIIGSRKAEEYNLSFFDAGGVPPVLIAVSGGTLASKTREALDAYMSANPKTKTRAVVLEVTNTTGAITDKNGSSGTKIQVEKFGDSQQKDAMFENYDANCEKRVRRAFRLPPLFVGLAEDHNYATAYASYLVAEAQVFKPERDQFDEVITLLLLRAMGGDEYVFRSKGMSITDVAVQYEAVQAAFVAQTITAAQYIEAVNELLSLDLEMKADADMIVQQTAANAQELHDTTIETIKNPPATGAGKVPSKSKKTKSESYVEILAKEMHTLVTAGDYGVSYRQAVAQLGELQPDELRLFKMYMARMVLGEALASPKHSPDLVGKALAVIAKEPVPEHV